MLSAEPLSSDWVPFFFYLTFYLKEDRLRPCDCVVPTFPSLSTLQVLAGVSSFSFLRDFFSPHNQAGVLLANTLLSALWKDSPTRRNSSQCLVRRWHSRGFSFLFYLAALYLPFRRTRPRPRVSFSPFFSTTLETF